MTFTIRLFQEEDLAAVVQLSLLAWAPIFQSFEQVLGHTMYTRIWPEWQVSQQEGIEAVCKDREKYTVYVVDVEGKAVGFIAYTLKHEEKQGEVHLLAVHPDYQNAGIGTALNTFVLDKMRESGMTLATVETGGDPGHAPARQSYEKAGYTGLPIVRYFKNLRDP